MTKSTPTLTQSGLLAALLQRQRYKVFQMARRDAQRKRVYAVFWNALYLDVARAHKANAARQFRRAHCESPPGGTLSYESRLLELKCTLKRRGSNECIAAVCRALKQQSKDLWNIL